ncbi:MAG: ribosome maturation factor RimP [Helcococcus sp.]|nr:ribosome maturation factor RimP [Helcococcus sp.]
MQNKLLEDLRAQLEPEIENLGYELVDLEFINEDGENRLRFYIYKEDGVSLDDTEIVSRYLDTRLDEIDPIDTSYYLEVSSPDLNRPLKTDDDLRRNLGNEINVHLYKKIDQLKEYEGYLDSYDRENLVIELENGIKKSFNRKDISNIKIAIRF